ncbi:hypothetical protein HNQ80_001777 [Anaerosolibacter carboniphilus]|uniref:Uncharacterized protein n=1 Tax=Anaerosolibacter carboniphilus TaxID=1417629 RepID=A0A841KU41_9FIRM|nr:hypothetical protein [Anaerosolibacter carboniphilus]
MEQLTREELDYLYTKPEKNDINKRINSIIGFRIVELIAFVGLCIFLWDKFLKYNQY